MSCIVNSRLPWPSSPPGRLSLASVTVELAKLVLNRHCRNQDESRHPVEETLPSTQLNEVWRIGQRERFTVLISDDTRMVPFEGKRTRNEDSIFSLLESTSKRQADSPPSERASNAFKIRINRWPRDIGRVVGLSNRSMIIHIPMLQDL